ncbi:membrane-spanning 4-domains subfamily A member 4A [Amia ocellicauda]|uniref:membrane-spanning 4-domains subfamily A member 4A n=1 Tax=Amia ocellicauda TaxID=2972642 RepID=UPI00346399A3
MSSSDKTDHGLEIVTLLNAPGQGAVPQVTGGSQQSGAEKTFLKGEPKGTGTAQIMIGLFIFTACIITWSKASLTLQIHFQLCEGILYIISGALCVHAEKTPLPSVFKTTLGFNIVSALTATMAIINYCFGFIPDLSHPSCFEPCSMLSEFDPEYTECKNKNHYWMMGNGMTVVLLIFSVLELSLTISTSVFGFRAVCKNSPRQQSWSPVTWPTSRLCSPTTSLFRPLRHSTAPETALVLPPPPTAFCMVRNILHIQP